MNTGLGGLRVGRAVANRTMGMAPLMPAGICCTPTWTTSPTALSLTREGRGWGEQNEKYCPL